MKQITILLAISVALMAAHRPKGDLGALEIAQLRIPDGIQLPADFKSAVESHLIEQIERTGRFSSVSAAGSHNSAAEPNMRLVVTLATFKKGSRGERYLLGPAFGNTVIKAHAVIADATTGSVKAEKDVGGRVAIGLFGGDSMGAANGLAKGVASLIKKQL
jgi:hypothetical protein